MGKLIKGNKSKTINTVNVNPSLDNIVYDKLNPNTAKPIRDKNAPVVNDESTLLENKRKAARRRAGGRAGTILTEGSTLG